ncbi:hypothetical protein ACWJJH_03265 [Endozoicomonadaceae bacterium StTr2]
MKLLLSYARNPFNSIFKIVFLIVSGGLSLLIPLAYYLYKILDAITSPVRNFCDDAVKTAKNENGENDEFLVNQVHKILPKLRHCSTPDTREYYVNEALDAALKIHDVEKRQQMMNIITSFK